MQSANDIVDFITNQPVMMAQLAVVERLGLPDCWVGAGFVRKAVWNNLSGKPFDDSHADIDVVYFDPSDISWAPEEAAEQQLQAWLQAPWSVKNQARMHQQKGDSPYRNTAEGIARWTETCTAVAARLNGEQVEILAPHGVDDLLKMIVRPTPYTLENMDMYRKRLTEKNWQASWPRLQFIGL